MKKILFALLLLVLASRAEAQVTAQDLMGLGMPGALAEKVANIEDASGTLSPAADNTYDIGTSSLGYRSGYFDTSVLTPLLIPPGDLTVRVDADSNRLHVLGASSDTVITHLFGDGSTASQTFSLLSQDADASDDSSAYFSGSGAVDSARGSYVGSFGNEVSSVGGDAHLVTGSVATADIRLDAQDDVLIRTLAGAATWTFDTAAGTIIGAGTGTIGWAVVAGANTACTTTCTTPCVFGVNTAATEADIVACTDATADECLCAGAS